MVEVDTRCGTIILADRVARRGIAIAAAIFGDDARIERALDLDLPREMAIEEMVGIGRDHPFGQVERLDEEEPPEIARRKLAVRLLIHRRCQRDVEQDEPRDTVWMVDRHAMREAPDAIMPDHDEPVYTDPGDRRSVV